MLADLDSLYGCAGLGLRRSMMRKTLTGLKTDNVSFWECAPENWIGVGGFWIELFRKHLQERPCLAHGLSLSIGGPAELNMDHVQDVADFLDAFDIVHYSEHLSYTADSSQLYELLPIPFTLDAAKYVAERVQRVQDVTKRTLSLENVSFYLDMGGDMSEADFLLEIRRLSGCTFLLDVNNLFCNEVNNGIPATALIEQLPADSVTYFHMAGHTPQPDGTVIDTHGNPVVDSVWKLYHSACEKFGALPTVLERDSNFPSLDELEGEVGAIASIQAGYSQAPALPSSGMLGSV